MSPADSQLEPAGTLGDDDGITKLARISVVPGDVVEDDAKWENTGALTGFSTIGGAGAYLLGDGVSDEEMPIVGGIVTGEYAGEVHDILLGDPGTGDAAGVFT
ncbi:hypothetical protein K7X08_020491 [Anisodus acutangulus]|uniref:Uncharacterized protein n=1 Tax=Anisodus acutangulus TaxID=402998 RepID=A0A9Q1M7M5_9SOLA|nr:hypothetical protein K7X08_020491 [Anisodus acutangulus]